MAFEIFSTSNSNSGGGGGGGGTGTVTSVAFSAGSSLFTVSGSPVTTSGTLGITLIPQSAGFALLGPTLAGASAVPSFRAVQFSDLSIAQSTKSASYQILVNDHTLFVDTSSAAFGFTLPSPTNIAGKIFEIYDTKGKLSTNNLTLFPNSTENIEGITLAKIFQTDWGGWEVTTNGTDWFVR